ncbi:S-layer homology domain-containing protein [Deinococcus apachensis]|uniref:S-layer homology domain-containing protein n=1 Tax=Deinococcus apachensis TaxID=309886 RepID=UPI000381D3B5|nr:S-layer homology domain-containing protein [Deinococcus apachensis]
MKKSLFVLTAALAFGAAAAQTATPATPATTTPAPAAAPQVPTLTDVPAGHWAKDAIDRLVSRGIILGYPDGTYRGTQNLTRYEAAVIIARLLDQIRTGDVPQGSLNADDLTALQNAIQELAADLTALGVRVSDLEENAVSRDDFSRLEARVEELAAANGDAAAIAGLQTQIAELTARADDYDALRADVDDNASQIAALNDLTVLLNQDILNLQDRVSAVESAQADFVQRSDFDNLAGRVGTVETRVTALENAPKFSVTGGLSPRIGRIGLTSGTTNFDVDRLTNGTFAAGVFSDLSAGADVTVVDTSQNFNRSLGLTFGVRASNLTTANGSVIVNSAAINFSTAPVQEYNSTTIRRAITLTDASANGTVAGGAFSVKYTEASNAFKFSDYLFSNSDGVAGPGFVATFSPVHPLNPTVTVVGGQTTSPALRGTTAVPNTYYYGARVVVKPNTNSTVGVSYAQTETSRTGFGVDYNVQLGIVNVKGEGVISIPNSTNGTSNSILGGNFQNAVNNGDKAFYTEARADLGVARFGVNFRTVDPDFAANNDAPTNIAVGNAALSINNTRPYDADQTGFGAAAGTALGPIALGAYGDTYVPYNANAPRTVAFGVKAGAKLGALELVGFFNRVTTGGTLNNAFSVDDKRNNDYADPGMGIADVPYAYTSTVGARLRHDGTATNALVPNLNFTVQDGYYYGSRSNDFQAYANYSGTLAGVTIAPLVRYHLRTSSNPGSLSTGDQATLGNTLKYGVKLSTAPLTAIPLQPSAYANVVNRISNGGTGVAVNNATTTELLGQVGISLNQFLAPGATAKVGYSYYQGFNVAGTTVGADDVAFSASDDRVYSGRGGQNGLVNGLYAQVGWNGLAANYGIFRYTNLNVAPGAAGRTNVGQGFRVNYTFNF